MQVYDERRQRFYYWNWQTEESVWRRPQGYESPDEAETQASGTETSSSVQSEAHPKNNRDSTLSGASKDHAVAETAAMSLVAKGAQRQTKQVDARDASEDAPDSTNSSEVTTPLRTYSDDDDDNTNIKQRETGEYDAFVSALIGGGLRLNKVHHNSSIFGTRAAPRTLWLELEKGTKRRRKKATIGPQDWLCWSSSGTGRTPRVRRRRMREAIGGAERSRGKNSTQIRDIRGVTRGIRTDVLRARGDSNRAECYFSLLMTSRGGNDGLVTSLDLEATSEDRRDVLASFFERLVQQCNGSTSIH